MAGNERMSRLAFGIPGRRVRETELLHLMALLDEGLLDLLKLDALACPRGAEDTARPSICDVR